MTVRPVTASNDPNENIDKIKSFFGRGVARISTVPRIWTIESTSKCNLKCVMCSHALPDTGEKFLHMPDEIIENISNMLAPAHVIQLHANGEPLLSPAFWRCLGHIRNTCHPETAAVVTSNGVILTDRMIQDLIDSGLAQIDFSIDAATPGTYRRIRGADFDKVIDNIRKLIETRNAQGRKRPAVWINMTLMRENIEELTTFVRLGKELGVDVVQAHPIAPLGVYSQWIVERDGWVFNYREQRLTKCKDLANSKIHEAIDLAKELGVQLLLDHKSIVYQEDGLE